MSEPKVSIVIVNWNNLSDTTECLESLKQINYSNYNIVMVDNGSDGDDAKFLKERFSDYIRLIANDRNYGFAEGCNIGIRDAIDCGAEYIVLLNNDTIVDPDFLSEVVKAAHSDRRIGIAGGKIYSYEIPKMIWFAGGKINYWTGKTLLRGSGKIDNGQFDESTEVNWICGCFMLISTDLLQKVGMLDKRLFFGWEDVDLCIRAYKEGFKIIFVPDSKIWHKTAPSDKKERLMGLPIYYAARGQFICMEKHFTKPQLISSSLYYFFMFPISIWNYSRILGHWRVIIYILRGFWGFLRMKFR
ncbi:MAG: glycosyltransferase family 2 protein [Spirochaetota bacterium]|nr:glycosyltransferase family 2 protein [Spirochaetota bacterium]